MPPQTKDGRVIFMLPFQGKVIAGTTDTPIPVSRTASSVEASSVPLRLSCSV